MPNGCEWSLYRTENGWIKSAMGIWVATTSKVVFAGVLKDRYLFVLIIN